MASACVHMYIDSDNEVRGDDKEKVIACALKTTSRVSTDDARNLEVAMLKGLLDSAVVANVLSTNKNLKAQVRLQDKTILKLNREIKSLKTDNLKLANFKKKIVGCVNSGI